MDVIDRLGERVGHQVDTPVLQVRQRSEPALVALGNREAIARPVEHALEQTLIAGTPQRVVATLVSRGQPRADQHSALELERHQVTLDQLEVVLVQLLAQHREESGEPRRVEVLGVRIGELAQPAKKTHEQLQFLNRTTERGARRVPEASPDGPLGPERLAGQVVELARHVGVLQAVGQHPLAIDDRLRIAQAQEQCSPGHVEDQLVACRHRSQQGLELEVLRHRFGLRGQVGVEREISVGVHQERLHFATRLRSVSWVRPYFSAIAAA